MDNFNKNNLVKLPNLILILGLINILFVYLTKQNIWISDDYPYIFGTKIYNLINEQKFYFFSTQENRFIPLYWFITQFIPTNYLIWHSLVVFFYFLSSLVIYFLTIKLTKNLSISFLTSIFYTLNYSISIKALSWAVFFGHVFNAFLGFLSILIFLKIYENNKKLIFVISFFIISLLNFLITEGALIYPLICLSIYLCIYRLKFHGIIISIVPLLIYILIVFSYTGKFLPLLIDRIEIDRERINNNNFNKSSNTSLYHYRSTYAPRNLEGYTIRIFDNISASINLSSIENSFKELDKNKKVEEIIKNNFKAFVFIFSFSLIIIIFFVAKFLKIIDKPKNYKSIIFIYLITLLIYSIIFFRRDINFGLSFISSLLISKILYDLYRLKHKLIITLILFLYITPTILFAASNFKFFGDFSRQKSISLFLEYEANIAFNKPNREIDEYNDFKYFYYFNNFDDNKDYLKKYKNLTLREFFVEFNKNE